MVLLCSALVGNASWSFLELLHLDLNCYPNFSYRHTQFWSILCCSHCHTALMVLTVRKNKAFVLKFCRKIPRNNSEALYASRERIIISASLKIKYLFSRGFVRSAINSLKLKKALETCGVYLVAFFVFDVYVQIHLKLLASSKSTLI